MRSLLITAIPLCIGISSIQAQSASVQTFTLAEAQAYAIKNNEQLKQAGFDIQISEAKVRETTAIGLPQLSGEAGMNYYIDVPTQVAPASTFDPTAPADILVPLQFGLPFSATAGITASQLLFDGSYFVGLKASKAYLNYSQLNKESTEISVRNQIAQTYFALLSLDKTLESLKANKLTVDQSSAETKALYEVGFAEKQDADQVRLAQSNLQYQIDMIGRQRASVMNALKFQIGLAADQEITLSQTFEELLGTVEGMAILDQSFSIENHIDYRTVNQGIELSELSLSAEKTKNYPQLAAFFNHSQNGFSQDFSELFSNTFYPTTIAGLQLNVPIFSSGMRFYKTKQAKLELEKTQSQKRQIEQNLNMQAETAQGDYASALQNMSVAKENLELAESIKKTTNTKYKEGVVSSLDYAQSESQYLQTLSTYINTAQNLFQAKLNLDKALGNN